MVQDPLLAKNSLQLYQQAERQRRVRLSFWFSITNTLAFIMYFGIDLVPVLTGNQPVTLGYLLTLLGLGLFASISLLGHWLSRQGRSVAAALCILIPIFIIITLFVISWINEHGLDIRAYLGMASYLIMIPLAGLLGNLILMFITVTLASAATLFIAFVQPFSLATFRSPGMSSVEISNVVTLIVLEWGLAMLMWFALSGYRRTLQELGDIQVQYERAKALDDLKDQFITNVNHELRNPVMAMQGYLDILEMSIDSASHAKIRQLILQAVQTGDSLRNLLTHILDARRLDQGASDFTPEAVRIRPVIDEAISLIDPNEANGIRDLTLSVTPDAMVWGEKTRLLQILTNLLSNAVKYSSPGTPIELVVRPVQEAISQQQKRLIGKTEMRTMIEITVRDHGLGIPPEQIPLLFQRFVRLPRDLASTTIGNGIGLFVCRALAEGMQGKIWVESTGVPGEGSTFFLRLPPPPTEAVPATEPTASVPQPVTLA